MSTSTPLLIINDVAARLHLSPVTIAHWAYRRKAAPKDFPEPIKIGNRLRWRPEAIDAWLDALQKVPHSAAEDAPPADAVRRPGRPRKVSPQCLEQEQGGAA